VTRAPRVLALLFALACGGAHAGGGPLGIDHVVAYDESGIWARKYQLALQNGVIATEIAGALWLGNDNQVGHVFWQTIDSSLISGVAANLMKVVFSRRRPDQGGDPNKWFQGHGYESFPSGEVTLQASFVTPFIAKYHDTNPWIWSLELLPIYDGIARIKSQAHWQTDVIAGWALGTGIGYWTSTFHTPVMVRVLPRGLSVGFYKRF
jgi:membrane-associated phospholipid phosphatase